MLLLEKIYDLTPDQSTVLHSELVDDQLIEVRDFENYRWLQIGGESIQSLLDVDSPSMILLPNIQAMMASLIFCPEPKRILNLGFGCGSIERFLNKNLPDIEIVSLESSEKVIQLARKFFFIDDNRDVINTFAEEFLANDRATYDIILCDIYVDEEHHECLYEADFYENVFNRLDKEGVLAINLLPESEEDVVEVLLPMKNYFNHISLYEVPDHINVVIFASNGKLPNTDELDVATNQFFEKTDLDLRQIPERLSRLLETV